LRVGVWESDEEEEREGDRAVDMIHSHTSSHFPLSEK